MEQRYTVITICDRRTPGGETSAFQDIHVEYSENYSGIQDRHFQRYGIAYRAMYIYDAGGDCVYSHAGYQTASALSEAESKDESYGYRDRKAGYYDKWYRYNRRDGGEAYDRGQKRAVRDGAPERVVFIECSGRLN